MQLLFLISLVNQSNFKEQLSSEKLNLKHYLTDRIEDTVCLDRRLYHFFVQVFLNTMDLFFIANFNFY